MHLTTQLVVYLRSKINIKCIRHKLICMRVSRQQQSPTSIHQRRTAANAHPLTTPYLKNTVSFFAKVSLCASSKFLCVLVQSLQFHILKVFGELHKFNYYTTSKITYLVFKNFGTTKFISVLVQSSWFQISKFLELQSLLLWQYKFYIFRLQKFFVAANFIIVVIQRTWFQISKFQNYKFICVRVQSEYFHIFEVLELQSFLVHKYKDHTFII